MDRVVTDPLTAWHRAALAETMKCCPEWSPSVADRVAEMARVDAIAACAERVDNAPGYVDGEVA